MAGLMDDALGIGLAAAQFGMSQRLLVYRVGPDAPLIALANPEIEWSSDDQDVLEEGCLSLPGVQMDIERPIHVRVRARDEHGDDRVIEASGLEARVIQHEMDHLDGVLILDRGSARAAQGGDARYPRGRGAPRARRLTAWTPVLPPRYRTPGTGHTGCTTNEDGAAWHATFAGSASIAGSTRSGPSAGTAARSSYGA